MRYLVLLAVLLMPCLALGEDAVCGNGPRPQCAQTEGLTQYIHAMDPSKITDPSCTIITKAQGQAVLHAQQALIQDAQQQGKVCYLIKDTTTLLARYMTPEEQSVVDDALAVQQAVQQQYEDELANNEICNTRVMTQIQQRITQKHDDLASQIQVNHDSLQSQIDAISQANVNTLKQGLTGVNSAWYQASTRLNDAYATINIQLARCLAALRAR